MEGNSMSIKSKLILDLKINSVEDLYKLKPFEENSSININKSKIARELDVDRRTVGKYINGFRKTWQYLVDNHERTDCKYSNFCHYIEDNRDGVNNV